MNDKNRVAAVANFSGAMEAETITKNGRSSKSLTSRGDFMQKIFLFFAILCVSTASAFAQDIIIFRNGGDIQAIVQEIGDLDIKYKRFDNPNGPNYTLKKSEIFMIRYANGSKDVFTEQQNLNIEKKNDIATFNAKELEQVLKEALEKILSFEEICDKIGKLEGVHIFYEQYPQLIKNEQKVGPLAQTAVREQALLELTGLTKADLAEDFNKRLERKPVTYFMPNYNKGTMYYYADRVIMGDAKPFLKSKDWELLRSSYAQDIEELTTIVENMTTEMEQNVVMSIPRDYRYSLALETMLGFVKNLRASTWKECSNLYEVTYHQWIMQANSAEAIRIQQEIRNYSKATAISERTAAIFSGLNFFLK